MTDLVGEFPTISELATPLVLAAVVAVVTLAVERSKRASRFFLSRPARRCSGNEVAVSADEVFATLLGTDREASGAAFWEDFDRNRIDSAPMGMRATARQLEALIKPGAHGLLTHFLFATQLVDVQARAARALAAYAPFRRLDGEQHRTRGHHDFACWVTDMTRAPILADPQDARARIANRVLVRSSNRYLGRPGAPSGFDDAHRDGCRNWVQPPRAGDHDGRVVVVKSCDVVTDPNDGALIYLLETDESCYAATERGDRVWGCKNLDSEQDSYGLQFSGHQQLLASGTRRPMLSSFASLLTTDDKLVLCRRSSAVNQGAGVLSATGGGVCEPGDSARAPLDRDPLGWPDPRRTVQRELAEEVGVALHQDALRPTCVFLSNSMNPTSGKGQLVVCTLYIGQTTKTFDEVVKSQRSSSDLAVGRYEVDQLVAIDVSTIDTFVASISEHIETFDQHAAVSCCYVAALLWGQETARAVLSPIFDTHASHFRSLQLCDPTQLLDRATGSPAD